MLQLDKSVVSPYIPKLLDALIVCFNDDSWPVRDGTHVWLNTLKRHCRDLLLYVAISQYLYYHNAEKLLHIKTVWIRGRFLMNLVHFLLCLIWADVILFCQLLALHLISCSGNSIVKLFYMFCIFFFCSSLFMFSIFSCLCGMWQLRSVFSPRI